MVHVNLDMTSCKILNTNPVNHSFEVYCEFVLPKSLGDAKSRYLLNRDVASPVDRNVNLRIHIDCLRSFINVDASCIDQCLGPGKRDIVMKYNWYVLDSEGARGKPISPGNRYTVPMYHMHERVYKSLKMNLIFQIKVQITDSSQASLELKPVEPIHGRSKEVEIKTSDGSMRVLQSQLMKWEYFRTVVENLKFSELGNNVWVVKDISLQLMKAVYSFVCCGAISFVDETQAMELMAVSHRFLLLDLIAACSEYLAALVNPKIVLPLLVMSDMYDQPGLKSKCSIFLANLMVEYSFKDLHGYAEFRGYSNHSGLTEECFEIAARQVAALKPR
ncbi:hypothetical protein HDE_08811 [Halotydeus destructor]|nr:hypothetical protein HDE_08811 [Halotydeus destructor]